MIETSLIRTACSTISNWHDTKVGRGSAFRPTLVVYGPRRELRKQTLEIRGLHPDSINRSQVACRSFAFVRFYRGSVVRLSFIPSFFLNPLHFDRTG